MSYQRRVGAKYRNELDVKEIAKRIRADIKIAVKSGHLPPELKASVKISGRQINVVVVSLPDGFKILNLEHVKAFRAPGYGHDGLPSRTPQASQVLKQIKDYVNAYKADYSDSQRDYCDVNFYGHVDYSDDLRSADYIEIEAVLLSQGEADPIAEEV